MAFYEITITGFKDFIVEADSQLEALGNEVVQEEMGWSGDIEWEADTAEAILNDRKPDLDQCRRHSVKVFDKDGVEYSD